MPNYISSLPTEEAPKPKNGKNGKKPKFESYVDPTGELSSSQLKFDLWLVKHKVRLRRISIVTLFLIGVVCWLYVAIYMAYYLAIGLEQDRLVDKSLINSFANFYQFHESLAPQPLVIINAWLYPSGVNKSNAVAVVTNPNPRQTAYFNYYFIVNGVATKKQSDFLLPGETRPIASLGVDGVAGGAVLVNIEDVNWKRVSNHQVVDVEAWKAERLNFSVSDFILNMPGGPDDPSAMVIRFKLHNDSSFGYVRPNFYVGLMQGGVLIGVLPLQTVDLPAGGVVNVDLRNFENNSNISEVVVYPLINLFDKAVYLPPPS